MGKGLISRKNEVQTQTPPFQGGDFRPETVLFSMAHLFDFCDELLKKRKLNYKVDIANTGRPKNATPLKLAYICRYK